MERIKSHRRGKARRRRAEKQRRQADRRARSPKARLVGFGAALLAVIGYLSAGDRLNDLAREWARDIQTGLVAIGVSAPFVRRQILSRFVAANFGPDICMFETGALDLEKDGRATDLVVMVAPVPQDIECGEIHNANAVVLKNAGWLWTAIEIIPPQTSSTSFGWRNGYLFGEVTGTDFPAFSVFAYEAGRLQEVYSDFGELPQLDTLFDRADRFRLLLSGRQGDVVISYDHLSGRHDVRRVDTNRNAWSALHVLSSVDTGGWRETYAFDGEVLNPEEETGEYGQYVGAAWLVLVPQVCDTANMVAAPDFPGYFRPNRQGQARVCCPVDVEEYGYCDQGQSEGTPDPLVDFETLIIKLH